MALHLPINGRCNIACVFCSAVGRGGDFELPYLFGEIDKDTTGHVQISGGDPMLRPPLELLALLAHCKKRRKIVEFQTNAVLVNGYDPKRLRQVLGLVDFFNVNFSAHTPELDVEVTETPGAFQARLKAVRLLLTLGAKVRLTYIVHGANFRHAPDFVRWVGRELRGIAWLQFSYVKGMGRAKGNRDIIPEFRVAAPYLNRAMALCRELEVPFDVDHIPVCFVLEFKDHHVDYRKMLEDRPGVHITEKQKVEDCESCNLRAVCPGPRRDYIELYQAL